MNKNAHMELARASSKMTSSLSTLHSNIRDVFHQSSRFKTIAAMRASALKHGLTQPAMEAWSFSMGRNPLELSVGVESLDILPLRPTALRAKTAIEEMDASLNTETSVIREWVDKAIATGSTLMVVADTHLDGLLTQVRELEEKLTGTSVETDVLNIVPHVNCSSDAFADAIDKLNTVVADIQPIQVESLESPEYRAEALQYLIKACDDLKLVCGLSTGSEDQGPYISQSDGKVGEQYQDSESTLGDLGFTVERFSTLLSDAEHLLLNVKSIVDNRATYIQSVVDASNATPQTAMEDVENPDSEDTVASPDAVEEHICLMCHYLCILSCVIRSSLDYSYRLIAVGEELIDHV